MHYVYVLESQKSGILYKGYTANLQSRIKAHNSPHQGFTAHHQPWKLIFYCSFKNKAKALDFEKYLKTPSGYAFMKKRLV